MKITEEMINDLNLRLDYKLWLFEQRLNIQMLLLRYGPDYVKDILDSIITELSTDKIIGIED